VNQGSIAIMCRTSRRRDVPLPDATYVPPKPSEGLCIDVNSTCFDACLGDTALQYFRKLSERHFKGNNYDAMDVKRSAQVMSNTMVKAIDRVCDLPGEYPMEKCPPGFDRTAMYSKVRQLCKHMNHFFDLCNSKNPDTNQAILVIGKHNAEKYAKEFLEVLGWFNEWKEWVKSLPGSYTENKKRFIPDETFSSLQSVCYGFAAAAYYLAKEKGNLLTFCRINQDVNEHHFGNVRAAAGSHNNPNQQECMAAVATSCVIRLYQVEKGNCSTLLGTKRTMLPLKMALGKRRRMGNH